MKFSFTLLFILFTSITFSQTLIATTEDGRRVVLNSDKTWSFIDTKPAQNSIVNNDSYKCNLPDDFEEPKGKNSAFLKRADATLKDLKKHVAIDYECSIKDIIVISASEQKGNANYVLCVSGRKVKYKRAGTVFFKDGKNPLGN
ncbi:hypothetical protein [Zunongwangia sp.]|uniref:hypothetical protein n=1 Tax=Zunongwangia sp. TaxID=1965325 RepID=UPI003AA9DE20